MTQLATRPTLQPLGSGTGAMITPSAGTGLRTVEDLHGVDLPALLAETGHLLLRGFAPDTDGFNALVERFSQRTTLDPARVFHGSSAQKVDSGHHAIGLHVENGATPFAPELLWFYCVTAARHGSETTICDGERVWAALSPRSRELFASQPIRYTRNVPAQLWRTLATFLSEGDREPATMTVDDLYRLANDGADVVFLENPDGSLHYEYTVHAAHPSRWSSTMTWANSLLGPSFNYEAPEIVLADGSTIPDEVVAEYTRVTEEVTEEIAWEDGDVVLIDNSRVMHGRRAITDPERTILNAQSFVR